MLLAGTTVPAIWYLGGNLWFFFSREIIPNLILKNTQKWENTISKWNTKLIATPCNTDIILKKQYLIIYTCFHTFLPDLWQNINVYHNICQKK